MNGSVYRIPAPDTIYSAVRKLPPAHVLVAEGSVDIGLDPEVSNFGNQPVGRFQDVTPYPPSRQYYLTIATNF